MKKRISNFIIKLFLISAILLIAEIVFFLKIKPEFYDLFYILLILVFFTMTSLSFYFQVKSLAKRPAKFFQTTMAFTGIRIIVYLIFLITYVLLTDTDKIAIFAIIFFVMYILYTVLELVSILKVLNLLKNEAKHTETEQNSIAENK